MRSISRVLPPDSRSIGQRGLGNGKFPVQVLYDLLVPNSAELPLREDPVLGAVPSGLTFANVSSANDILHLLETGNARRKTERTDANTQSSRSHAVLEVCINSYSLFNDLYAQKDVRGWSPSPPEHS